MMIRFHLDEHVAGAIADGLRRRGIDVTTTADARLSGAPDTAHLDFAMRERRVLVTHDSDFLVLAAGGQLHAGIIYCGPAKRSVGRLLAHLELVFVCMEAEEMMNHIEFV